MWTFWVEQAPYSLQVAGITATALVPLPPPQTKEKKKTHCLQCCHPDCAVETCCLVKKHIPDRLHLYLLLVVLLPLFMCYAIVASLHIVAMWHGEIFSAKRSPSLYHSAS